MEDLIEISRRLSVKLKINRAICKVPAAKPQNGHVKRAAEDLLRNGHFVLVYCELSTPDIGINEDIKKNYGPTLIFISPSCHSVLCLPPKHRQYVRWTRLRCARKLYLIRPKKDGPNGPGTVVCGC